MLTLDRRDCKLGTDHSGKTKEPKDGGEKIRLLTFELVDVPLDERELNAFLREPHAYRSLYNDGPDGVTPFLKCFKAMELDKPIDGAYVAITFGLDATEMAFADVKLSKIRLTLCDGGRTMLACKVTAAPTLDETLAALIEQFGNDIEVELRAEPPGAQQDLPLNQHGEGETVTEFPGRNTKRRGRPRKDSEHRAH